MNNFVKYVLELFTWKGRIGRLRFLVTAPLIWLPVWIITGPADLLEMQFHYRLPATWESILMTYIFAYMCIGIPLIILNMIKRLHDLNQTGWVCLINLIPGVGLLLLIYLLFWEGTKDANKYGEPPIW